MYINLIFYFRKNKFPEILLTLKMLNNKQMKKPTIKITRKRIHGKNF